MRILGITLLLGGFCWIAWEITMGFSQYQYLQWIIHTRGSPNESISRTEASKLLSEVCLALNVRQRSLIPRISHVDGWRHLLRG